MNHNIKRCSRSFRKGELSSILFWSHQYSILLIFRATSILRSNKCMYCSFKAVSVDSIGRGREESRADIDNASITTWERQIVAHNVRSSRTLFCAVSFVPYGPSHCSVHFLLILTSKSFSFIYSSSPIHLALVLLRNAFLPSVLSHSCIRSRRL